MSRRVRMAVLSLTFAVLLLIALLVFPLTTYLAEPPAWREQLDRYLAFQAASQSVQMTVLATSHASEPWQFTTDLGGNTIADSSFFATDLRYSSEGQGVNIMPYPAAGVWCVLLRREGSSTRGRRQVVFLAMHENLYNADWIVHEGAWEPFSPQFVAGLARIGCALPGVK
jgi:hypothetical protein